MISGPAEPIRPIFWNIHENYHWAEVSQYVLGSLAALLFLWGVYRHFARWRTGKPEAVLPAWPVRIRAFIQFALLQGRLVSDRYALTMHLAIFLGMCALFVGTARTGDSRVYGWSAAAAIGAAVGPAAGGVLTQIFDWRSIFFAQAPVAAFAAVAVLLARPRPVNQLPEQPSSARPTLDPLSANLALTFLSAGLIGALFLVVIELINAWLVSPIGAAAIVTTIPVATALAERAVRGISPIILGIVGAVLLAAGLVVLSAIPHRELGLVVVALTLCVDEPRSEHHVAAALAVHQTRLGESSHRRFEPMGAGKLPRM